jgi:hypothetical protein
MYRILAATLVCAALLTITSSASAQPVLTQHAAYEATIRYADALQYVYNTQTDTNGDTMLNTIATCSDGRITATRFVCTSESEMLDGFGLNQHYTVTLHNGRAVASPMGNAFEGG